jgi:hypothetical protein
VALYLVIAGAVIIGVAAANWVIQKVLVPLVALRLMRPEPPPRGSGWIVLRRRGTPRRH